MVFLGIIVIFVGMSQLCSTLKQSQEVIDEQVDNVQESVSTVLSLNKSLLYIKRYKNGVPPLFLFWIKWQDDMTN